MSINMSAAINPKKTKHLGEYFNTIDFETISEGKNIGMLLIGNNKFKLNIPTLKDMLYEFKFMSANNRPPEIRLMGYEFQFTNAEINRIYETLQTAFNNINKRIKLGI